MAEKKEASTKKNSSKAAKGKIATKKATNNKKSVTKTANKKESIKEAKVIDTYEEKRKKEKTRAK